jgi:hypothetical protein
MKAQEIQLKLTFYTYANTIIANNKEIIASVLSLISTLKDTPIDELQDKFIETLAEIIHESGKDDE